MLLHKTNIACILFLLNLMGCLDNGDIHFEDDLANPYPQLEAAQSQWVDMTLSAGRLTASDQLEKYDVIEVNSITGIKHFQVIAELDSYVKNYEFLRVEFTSDRMEWVSSGPESNVYETESDCEEDGYNCDLVIPAEGVGGVFFAGGKLVAITNSYCLDMAYDYQYTVYAYVVNIAGAVPEIVSDLSETNINCLQK